jgi:hypothetical protein
VDQKAKDSKILSYNELWESDNAVDAFSPKTAARANGRIVLEWEWQYNHLATDAEKAAVRVKSTTLDLRDPCGGNACGTRVVVNRVGRPDYYVPEQLNVYQERVIHLRKGDVVKSGKREFRLGKFLGAGNTTHIWEVEGEPGKVLRIPFLAEPAHYRAKNMLTLQAIRMRLRAMMEYPKTGFRHVTVHEVGAKFEYALVSRINGTMSGEAFAKTYEAFLGELAANRAAPHPIPMSELALKHSMTEQQALKIARQGDKLDAIRKRLDPESDITEDQFIWEDTSFDGKPTDDWILGDW